jgi:hypothetical protein
MPDPQHQNVPATPASGGARIPWKPLIFPLSLLALLSTAAGFGFAHFADQATQQDAASISSSASLSLLNHTPNAKKTDLEDIASLPPQQQAERLLENAIQHRDSSIDLIHHDVDSWRGRIQNTGPLFDLVLKALTSDDVRVRTAAIEIDLAANNLNKSPQSIAHLVQIIRRDPVERPFALWRLGSLGNRGVEPQTVLSDLISYSHDQNENTRYWAVQGLAMLGTADAIDPLLDRFAHDPSPRVRQRAGLSLSLSGMLTSEQRIAAVPDLLNLLDDDSLDHTTRTWIFGALHLITGATLPNTEQAWQNWWAHHDDHPAHRSAPDHLSHA